MIDVQAQKIIAVVMLIVGPPIVMVAGFGSHQWWPALLGGLVAWAFLAGMFALLDLLGGY